MKKSNVIGAVVMAAAILISLPLGVNRSFARLREKVQNEYCYDNTGYAIYQGLDTRQAEARNLITLAKRYVEKDPELDPLIDQLEWLTDMCEKTWFSDVKDVGKTVEYNERMGQAAEALAKQLSTVQLAEKDAKYPDRIMANLRSEQDKIERSSFNDKVIEYNDKLAGFPARVLAPIAGVREIVPFGRGSSPDYVTIKVVETK